MSMSGVFHLERIKDVPAVTEGLSDPLFTVTVSLLPAFNSHVEGAQMVLQFEINGALGSRKSDFFNLLFPGDLVNLGDVLADDLIHGDRC